MILDDFSVGGARQLNEQKQRSLQVGVATETTPQGNVMKRHLGLSDGCHQQRSCYGIKDNFKVPSHTELPIGRAFTFVF